MREDCSSGGRENEEKAQENRRTGGEGHLQTPKLLAGDWGLGAESPLVSSFSDSDVK